MTTSQNLLQTLDGLNAAQLKRLLVDQLTKQKLGLYWENSAIERDAALNAHIVLPRLVGDYSHGLSSVAGPGTPNLIIEGDNYDSLRLLRSTHAGKVRVIYIDPPYNTGNKDWVYNDRYVGANDRWRHSQWLEFLYRRLALAKDLLTQDGVIMVSINDENRARLELLMDEVFPGRRVGSLVWRKRRASNAAGVEHFFSSDHEHVLVYANTGFDFNGSVKNWSGYTNWDENKQDFWTSDNLTLGFNAKERKNLFFPLHNPITDIWYPCDWNNVWRYASRAKLDGKEVRTQPMEDWIAEDGIYFREEKPVQYASLAALKTAIANKSAPPFLDKSDDLDFWINKKIGSNKPRFKRYKKNLRNETQPLSSWVAEAGKSDPADASDEGVVLSSGMTSEGTKLLRGMNLDNAFPYPKPLSLIQGLVAQASRPGDIVLDFFAGSGTTGHAVLALNALEPDAAPRKFILCSSTEATDKEPAKNLCRDVCAARISKVITSDAALAHNSFAYLQLDKIAPGDAPFESDCAHAFQLLTLRLGKVARPVPAATQGMKILLQSVAEGSLTVLVHRLTPATLAALAALPLHPSSPRHGHLRVYSTRPDTVRQHLQQAWDGTDKVVESLSLQKALLHGQIAPRRKAAAKSPGAPGASNTPAGMQNTIDLIAARAGSTASNGENTIESTAK